MSQYKKSHVYLKFNVSWPCFNQVLSFVLETNIFYVIVSQQWILSRHEGAPYLQCTNLVYNICACGEKTTCMKLHVRTNSVTQFYLMSYCLYQYACERAMLIIKQMVQKQNLTTTATNYIHLLERSQWDLFLRYVNPLQRGVALTS